jgi:hypothetical protein
MHFAETVIDGKLRVRIYVIFLPDHPGKLLAGPRTLDAEQEKKCQDRKGYFHGCFHSFNPLVF